MVTCRQIQELTKARLEGAVPSYPEQWFEGPMARRDRALMRRGVARRPQRLPKVKAPRRDERSPSPPGSGGESRPRSRERNQLPPPKNLKMSSGGKGPLGDEEHAQLSLPLKPLRWPRVRDEQLQTVCSIKRMLKELHLYLQANSSTLAEALPRRSVG